MLHIIIGLWLNKTKPDSIFFEKSTHELRNLSKCGIQINGLFLIFTYFSSIYELKIFFNQ